MSFDKTFGDPSWLAAHGLAVLAVAASAVSLFDPSLDGLSAKAQSEVVILGPVVAASLVLGHKLLTLGEQLVQVARGKVTVAAFAADVTNDVPALKVDVAAVTTTAAAIPALQGTVTALDGRLATAEATLAAQPDTKAITAAAIKAVAARMGLADLPVGGVVVAGLTPAAVALPEDPASSP